MAALQLLALNAGVSALCFLALWLASVRLRDPSVVDAWWPLGMVVMAVTSLIGAEWSSLGGDWMVRFDVHGLLLTGLCALWGLRLGLHLFWRWRRHGPDPRYARMMAAAKAERGWDYPVASLLLVFALQYPLQFIVCLPAQLGQVGGGGIGAVAWIGASLALIGIVFETVGDAQLSAFKANPANKGKVLQTGLWRYTRHPNYFGDACVWWGLFLIAAETPFGVWSLPGPVLLTVLLTRVSGVPTTEGRMRDEKPEYAAYLARTSGFIPWFPKRA